MQVHRLIAIIGGADPDDPMGSSDRVTHLAQGTVQVLAALWTFFAFTSATHDVIGLGWLLSIVIGVIFALMIFCIDVKIVGSPLKEDTAYHRGRLVLVRGSLSIMIGAVVAYCSVLSLDHDKLAEIASNSNVAVAQVETGYLQKHSQWATDIAALKAQIAQQQTDINGYSQGISKAQAESAILYAAWKAELKCGPGGLASDGDPCGPGPKSNALYNNYVQYSTVTEPRAVNAYEADISTAKGQIATLQNEISADGGKLDAQIQGDTAPDLSNKGLAANSDALVSLLHHDVMAWLLLLFFIALDMVVMMLKVLFPEPEYDRVRRRRREQEDRQYQRDRAQDESLYRAAQNSAQWNEVAEHAARRLAEVEKARIDADAERRTAAINAERRLTAIKDSMSAQRAAASGSAPGDVGDEAAVDDPEQQGSAEGPDSGPPARRLPPRPRRRPLRGRPRARIAGVVAVALLVLIPAVTHLVSSTRTSTAASVTALPGQAINLSNGEKLTIPLGATSGNAAVTATYASSDPWAGYSPASAEVTFSSTGNLIGQPVLSLPLTGSLASAGSEGALVVAYKSDGGWKAYPQAAYNPKTHTLDASLTHFSTWRFWKANWAANLASITQSIGQYEGRRADPPDCTGTTTALTRYVASTGSAGSSGLPVLGCVAKEPGSSLLDVKLVNNRPYGLMLHYGGTTVQSGTHAPPTTLIGALQDAAGDYAAQTSDSLYLPPLSSASVEIPETSGKGSVTFTITPTPATVLADALSMSAGPLVEKAATTAAVAWGHSVIAAAASGSCAKFLATYPATPVLDQSTAMDLLTSGAPECIKDILALATGNDGAALGAGTIGVVSAADSALDTIIDVGKWADVAEKLGKVLDFVADNATAALPALGLDFLAI